MNPASRSISDMYRLEEQAFEDQFHIKATNVRRMLLEQFILAPLQSADDDLDTLGRTLVKAQQDVAAFLQIPAEVLIIGVGEERREVAGDADLGARGVGEGKVETVAGARCEQQTQFMHGAPFVEVR
jgi:hypothetical protein